MFSFISLCSSTQGQTAYNSMNGSPSLRPRRKRDKDIEGTESLRAWVVVLKVGKQRPAEAIDSDTGPNPREEAGKEDSPNPVDNQSWE